MRKKSGRADCEDQPLNRGQESRLEQDSRRLLLDRPPELFVSVYIPLPGPLLSLSLSLSFSTFLAVFSLLLSHVLFRPLSLTRATPCHPFRRFCPPLRGTINFPDLNPGWCAATTTTTTADRFRFHRDVHVYARRASAEVRLVPASCPCLPA